MPSKSPPALSSDVWSRVATSLDVKTLGRLACVARTFAVAVQDAARVALNERWPEDVRQMVWTSDVSPLRQLHEAAVLSAPPRFTLCGPDVVLSGNQTEATNGGWWQTAICQRADGVEMRTGRHFCEFTLCGHGGISGCGDVTHADGDIGCWVGVVPSSFDPREGIPAINATPSGWFLYTQDCQLFRRAKSNGVAVAEQGDVVGLLLALEETAMTGCDSTVGGYNVCNSDCDAVWGSLTVFLNGICCGHLLQSNALCGPLRWAADVGYGVRVGIRGAPFPAVL